MATLGAQNLFNVKDKVVLVTGGSRGFGKMVPSNALSTEWRLTHVFVLDRCWLREEWREGERPPSLSRKPENAHTETMAGLHQLAVSKGLRRDC